MVTAKPKPHRAVDASHTDFCLPLNISKALVGQVCLTRHLKGITNMEILQVT